jgi:heme-degrading monooxygenase HmoA
VSESQLAKTPQPPYYAVIFTSTRTPVDDAGYGAAAERMAELADKQPGYLGIDSVRDTSGVGITVSYWANEESILAWRRHAEHTIIREQGRAMWYQEYELRVAKVERAYGFSK